MATIELTAENFDAAIQDNDMLLVDFWADWCGPCKMFAPVFEAASEKYPDVVFGKVDTQSQQDLAARFNIRSIPTLMVFREQIILFMQAGSLPPAALEEVIGKAKELDMEQVRADIAKQQQEA